MKLNDYAIKRTALTLIALAALLSVTAVAQESRSEFSVEGTGLFTKSNSGNGVQNGLHSGNLPGRVQANVHQITGRNATATAIAPRVTEEISIRGQKHASYASS